ncbi:MAG: electron transfer flavoprotein subunit beta/FixA family protein [Desulfopila sp.]
MKILVCMKQVPDMESRFTVDSAGTWYNTAELVWRMNEYDEYGVEQAVQLKEQTGGEATILSIGPDRVKETMKKGLAMGCDRGVHIDDPDYASRDPYQMATIIANFAKDKGFDIILTGMQSQDRGSAQVGVLIAEQLGLPAVTTIVEFSLDNTTAKVKRELEGGVKALVALELPALFTCQLGLNTPRYPTLPNIMKAKKKELLSLPVKDFLTVEARVETTSMQPPEKKGGGLVLEGDAAELAEQLIKILKEKTGVLAK